MEELWQMHCELDEYCRMLRKTMRTDYREAQKAMRYIEIRMGGLSIEGDNGNPSTL